MDLDSDIENIFLDDEEEEQMDDQETVYEEGIDEELWQTQTVFKDEIMQNCKK